MKKNNQAFTLVELIVVITILAILGTIAFISLQGYSKDTRNSVRLSDLSNIDKMLGIKMVTVGKVPFPDDYVEITASGTVLNYQGEAGAKVLETLGVFNGGKDPKDETYYTYSTDLTRTKYQLLGFLEGEALAKIKLIDGTYAVTDLSDRQVKVKGEELGILLNQITNKPVTNTVDVVNTTDTYTVAFSENDLIEGTGTVLFSNIYNRNETLLNNKELAKLDDSLVLYLDMETLTGGLLKDFSNYGNNGILYGDIDVGGVDGKYGKSTFFDKINDYIKINDDDSLDIQNEITMDMYVMSTNPNINFPINQHYISKSLGFNDSLSYSSLISNGVNDTVAIVLGDGINKYYCLTDPIGELMEINKWYKITTTFNGYITKIYINGIIKSQCNTFTGKTIQSTNYPLFIGQDGSNTRFYDGKLDEVRIYNRALSDYEIEKLYTATK